ncbi:uncharacterized protein LOC144144337 isoform X1 [Haemaphysalis longicornis]
MQQSSVAYKLKWGYKTKITSLRTAKEMCAQYKKKVRSVLNKNKALVRALVAAKAELSYFKEAASRWDKNENLHLPMLKLWLEADLDHIRALFENHVRAATLVKGLLTPGANVTLTAADGLLNQSTTESMDEQQASPHPPGSRYCGRDRSLSMVLEEDEEYGMDFMAQPHHLTEPLQPEPEIGRFSKVTFRKKRRSGRRRSLLEDPLLASLDQPSVAPAAASSMAQVLSSPVSEGSPGVTESSLLSPTCVFDMGFMETPSHTLPTEKVADFRVDEHGPEKARTRRSQSALKARPSEGVQKKATSLIFGPSHSGQMAGDADVAIPPRQSVNREQQDEGGGGTQLPRCSAALDVAGPRPEGHSALQPRQDLCADKKPPQARKSRGRKKTADSKAPAPPKPADPSSPPSRTRRRGRLPLDEPVAAGPSSAVGEGSPPRRPSGRPVRSATKCATYKEPDLRVKLR